MTKLKVTLEDRPIDIELAQYKRMFEAACSALGEVGEALGIDPNEGGAEPILAAIAELRKQQPADEPVAIKWEKDADKECPYNNWVGITPFGRILITWKGWKDYDDACVDEFPGDFRSYGSPDEVKAACEAEYLRRLYTRPQPADEPVAKPMHPEIKKLYEDFFDKHFAETQRAWVELTDDEIEVIYEQHHNQYGECESVNWGYERAIEAKLKGKHMIHTDEDDEFARIELEAKMRQQKTKASRTPNCPKGLVEFHCDVEGVDLICFLEYTPSEDVGRDSYGLPSEPGTDENIELVNAYVAGTDVDIGHLLLQYLVDHITTTALEDLKNDDY